MDVSELIFIPLIMGFILDSFLGDPLWLPHPIRLFGKIISYFEQLLNKSGSRKIKGAIMSVFLISGTWGMLWLLFHFLKIYPLIYFFIASIAVFYGIANRNLIQESYKVIKVLNNEGLENARKQLSYIVGRDTKELSENQIRKAVLETLAENLSDGVIAPLFYYMIGGVPLMFAYKMINTLDSMIGYKNERYMDFGWFAAKTDDLLNYIPARITAMLMVIITSSKRGLFFIFKYGNKHSSPNAGYPEAALAGVLNCQFGGENKYGDQWIYKPLIGNHDRELSDTDIKKAAIINSGVTLLFILLFALFLWIVQ